jgi:hypothetical protein
VDWRWQVQERYVHEGLLRVSGVVSDHRPQLHQASQATIGGHAAVSADVVHMHGALRCSFRVDVHPHHMRTAPWQVLAIYGIVLLMAAGKLLKRLHGSGALADFRDGIKDAGTKRSLRQSRLFCALCSGASRCVGNHDRCIHR